MDRVLSKTKSGLPTPSCQLSSFVICGKMANTNFRKNSNPSRGPDLQSSWKYKFKQMALDNRKMSSQHSGLGAAKKFRRGLRLMHGLKLRGSPPCVYVHVSFRKDMLADFGLGFPLGLPLTLPEHRVPKRRAQTGENSGGLSFLVACGEATLGSENAVCFVEGPGFGLGQGNSKGRLSCVFLFVCFSWGGGISGSPQTRNAFPLVQTSAAQPAMREMQWHRAKYGFTELHGVARSLIGTP